MATKDKTIKRITMEKAFAVLRLKDTSSIENVAEALIKGGITIIEVTLNSQNAFDSIHRLSDEFPDCLIGAGTVIGYENTVKAIEQGAKFVVSPVTDLDMVAVAQQIGVASMAGALTPTEAWQANQAGADFVKLFPLVGLGPQFIRAMRGPLDTIRFVPTNGVTPENAGEYLDAGAAAVGIGTPLVSGNDISERNYSAIEARARMIVDVVAGRA